MERCNCKHIVTAEKCFLACSDYCKEEKHCHLKTQTRNNHVLDVVPGRLLCRQVLVNGAPDFKQHPSSIQRMQTWPARAATSLCFLGFFARKRRCRQWSEIWRPNSWLLPRYCFFEKGNIGHEPQNQNIKLHQASYFLWMEKDGRKGRAHLRGGKKFVRRWRDPGLVFNSRRRGLINDRSSFFKLWFAVRMLSLVKHWLIVRNNSRQKW